MFGSFFKNFSFFLNCTKGGCFFVGFSKWEELELYGIINNYGEEGGKDLSYSPGAARPRTLRVLLHAQKYPKTASP